MSFGTIVSSVIVVALLEGSIYFDIADGDFRNRTAGISMWITFMAFMCFDILLLWPAEKSVYLRDQVRNRDRDERERERETRLGSTDSKERGQMVHPVAC
eukprot:SAG22_NODE_1766_length_3623_cov_2.997162_4_plen_100_part_00